MVSSREIVNLINVELSAEQNPSASRALKNILEKIELLEHYELDKMYQEHVKSENERKRKLFEHANKEFQKAFTKA